MKRALAIFFFLLYSCFISATLWAEPVFDSLVYERSLENSNNEKSKSESGKEIEAPDFVRIHKNLPAKIKIPRVQFLSLNLKKISPYSASARQLLHYYPALFIYDLPLFIKHGVFRI